MFFRIAADASGKSPAFELELNAGNATNQKEDMPMAGGQLLCPPGAIHFSRQFLLVVRERDSEKPLVVLWVDNAELISPRPAPWPSVLRAFW